MSYKPDESTLAEYLAGELSAEENAKVEAYLEAHPSEKKELEEILSMQKMMGKLGDKEVAAPSFVFEESPTIMIAKHRFIDRFLKSSLAIAASIALLLLVGYFTSFSITQNLDGLQISFGNTISTDGGEMSKDEMKAWMQEALAENNNELLNQINEVKSELGNSKNVQLASNKTTPVAVDKQLVEQYISELRLANRDIILRLLEDSERSQQAYFTGVMTDFANFMETQREKDLDRIQLQFSSFISGSEDRGVENYLTSE
jgi:hypothetical protein